MDSQPLVMVVDDDPDLLFLITEELADAGYRIQEATNGREALDAMDSQAPDAIVSDVMMPDMDGVDLYWAVQDKPDLRDVPFIFLTALRPGMGDARLLDCSRALRSPKPIDFDELIRQLSTLTDTADRRQAR